MKRIIATVAAFLFTMMLSIGALAETQTKSLTLVNAVELNGKTVPAGDYRVKVDTNGSTAQVTILKGKTEVASAPAQVTQLPKKQMSTQIQTDHSGNTARLNEIDFGGSTTGLRFAGTTTEAGK